MTTVVNPRTIRCRRRAGRLECVRLDGREQTTGLGRADGVRLPGERRHARGEVGQPCLDARRIGGEGAELMGEGGDDQRTEADDEAEQGDEDETEGERPWDAVTLQPGNDRAEGAREHEGDDEHEDDLPEAHDEQDAPDDGEDR